MKHRKIMHKAKCICGGNMEMFNQGWTCEFDKEKKTRGKTKRYSLNYDRINKLGKIKW